MQELQASHSDHTPNAVILSGEESSLHELSSESKDPYHSTGVILLQEMHTIFEGWALIGVLRLRGCFAKRSSHSAQDDR